MPVFIVLLRYCKDTPRASHSMALPVHHWSIHQVTSDIIGKTCT